MCSPLRRVLREDLPELSLGKKSRDDSAETMTDDIVTRDVSHRKLGTFAHLKDVL